MEPPERGGAEPNAGRELSPPPVGLTANGHAQFVVVFSTIFRRLVRMMEITLHRLE